MHLFVLRCRKSCIKAASLSHWAYFSHRFILSSTSFVRLILLLGLNGLFPLCCNQTLLCEITKIKHGAHDNMLIGCDIYLMWKQIGKCLEFALRQSIFKATSMANCTLNAPCPIVNYFDVNVTLITINCMYNIYMSYFQWRMTARLNRSQTNKATGHYVMQISVLTARSALWLQYNSGFFH